ncbi:UNVERIFIED_CONTAM: transcription factor IIA subunit alpha [Siphonaria sp. JEL0065]|nr:transcription factor IIA subunit alpha [Siphonaria sp. JEL0065]
MSNQAVPNVYTWVIDDVVTKVRPHFQSVGLSDQILTDIEKKWKEKLVASKVATFSNLQAQTTQQHQQLPPPPQLQQQQQQQQFQPSFLGGGYQQASLYQTHQQPQQQHQYYQDTDFLNTNNINSNPYQQQLRHQQQQQQQQNPNFLNFGAPQMQLPPLQPPQYGRPNPGGYQLNQNDGASSDDIPRPDSQSNSSHNSNALSRNEIDVMLENGIAAVQNHVRQQKKKVASKRNDQGSLSSICAVEADEDLGVEITDVEEKKRVFERVFKNKEVSQVDGPDDDDDDDDDEDEDNNRLGSDLDSNDDDEDDDPDLNDLILCQYEKVNRTKNKWKCVFKDGIVHVNGKDYLFHKANADFEW